MSYAINLHINIYIVNIDNDLDLKMGILTNKPMSKETFHAKVMPKIKSIQGMLLALIENKNVEAVYDMFWVIITLDMQLCLKRN